MDQSGSRSAYRGGSPANPTWTIVPVGVVEKAEGTVAGGFTEFKFKIVRSDVNGEATIKWGLDIPADAGLLDATAADFDAVAAVMVNFAHQQAEQEIIVIVKADDLVELNEAFKVELSDASIGQISAANGTTSGRILTDDAPPASRRRCRSRRQHPPSPRAIQGRRNTSSRSAAMQRISSPP